MRVGSAGWLCCALAGLGLAAGCEGRTSRAPDEQPSDAPHGMAGDASAEPTADGGGADTAMSGRSTTGGRAPAGVGGKPAAAGSAGKSVGGSAGSNSSGAGGSAGSNSSSAGAAGVGGSNSPTYCLYRPGITYSIGDIFYEDCKQCECLASGSVTCATTDCDTDCEYIGREYEGAYGQAQYCLLGPTPDPCTRRQAARLDCNCPTPVSTSQEFLGYSLKWTQKWHAAGCKGAGNQCPPCPPASVAYCDQDQGICRFK